jgi:hypothetical protein
MPLQLSARGLRQRKRIDVGAASRFPGAIRELARRDLGLVAVGGYPAALAGLTDKKGLPRRPGDIDFVHDFSSRTIDAIVEVMKEAGAEHVPLVETADGYFAPEKKPADYETNPRAKREWDAKVEVRRENFTDKPSHMRLLTQYRIGDEIIDFFSCGGNDPAHYSFDRLMDRAHKVQYGDTADDGFLYAACLDDMTGIAERLIYTGPERNVMKNRVRLAELRALHELHPLGYPVEVGAEADEYVQASIHGSPVHEVDPRKYSDRRALEAALAERQDNELLALGIEAEMLTKGVVMELIGTPNDVDLTL